MNGRLRVVVATTDGPSTVRRITAEDPGLRSVICLAGTSTALPISNAYDAFVRRPTGVIERDVGHPVFRLDLDQPIDAGASWQLGVYLAHRLKAADRLAEDAEAADGVLWATGTVDADLNVGPVDRVAEKARRCRDVFVSDVPVLAVCARENATEMPDDGKCLAIERVGEALDILGLAGPPAPVRGGRRRPEAWGTLVMLLIAVLGFGVWNFWNQPSDPGAMRAAGALEAGRSTHAPASEVGAPFDPGSVILEVLDARARSGSCGAATLSAPRSSPAGAEGADLPAADATGVCAVVFRVTNTGDRSAYMWLYGAVQGAVREYASRRRHVEVATGTLVPGEQGAVRVQPPDWVRREVVVRGLLVLTGEPDPQVTRALSGLDLMSVSDLDKTVAGLRANRIHVREIVHRVAPAR